MGTAARKFLAVVNSEFSASNWEFIWSERLRVTMVSGDFNELGKGIHPSVLASKGNRRSTLGKTDT
jgi:hypothetical protein